MISRSIPPLRFAAKTTCPQPAREHQSPIFQCPAISGGSMWWEVGLCNKYLLMVTFQNGVNNLIWFKISNNGPIFDTKWIKNNSHSTILCCGLWLFVARGLDIPHIRTVVNYDVARDIDTHTHRIGRTGRAGEKGTAYTLVTNKDKDFAGHLVRNLEGANQYVPQDLMDIAMQVSNCISLTFTLSIDVRARGAAAPEA